MREVVLAALLLLSNCRPPQPQASPSLTSYDPSPVVRWSSNYYRSSALPGWQFHGVRWQQNQLQIGLQVPPAMAVQFQTADLQQKHDIAQQACPPENARVWQFLRERRLEIWLLNEEEAVIYNTNCEKPLLPQYPKPLLPNEVLSDSRQS
jgi:hypothetical protein